MADNTVDYGEDPQAAYEQGLLHGLQAAQRVIGRQTLYDKDALINTFKAVDNMVTAANDAVEERKRLADVRKTVRERLLFLSTLEPWLVRLPDGTWYHVRHTTDDDKPYQFFPVGQLIGSSATLEQAVRLIVDGVWEGI